MKTINKMNVFDKKLFGITILCHNFDEENLSWK